MEQETKTPPTYDEMVASLEKSIKLAELQVRMQELNMQMASYRAVELESFAKIQHFSKPNSNQEMIEHIVSEDDMKNNPQLAEQGIKAGDKITIPKSAIVNADNPETIKKADEIAQMKVVE